MKSINIIVASRPVLKGNIDTTPQEEKRGILIGQNMYYEHGKDPDGNQYAYTGDIFLVDDEHDLDLDI